MRYKILALDDEPIALNEIVKSIKEAVADCEIKAFDDPEDALQEIAHKSFAPDVAFLDIEMPCMSGLELAKRIRECSRQTRVVFVTGYSSYAAAAYSIHARGYLLKPPNADKVRAEMENIFDNALPLLNYRGNISVRCFGNFEVFSNGLPLHFSRSKTKELFAYLIDRRGAAITSEELLCVLWEDAVVTTSLRSQLRNSIAELSRTLKGLGEEDVLVKINRNSYAVDIRRIDCDYYRFLNHDTEAVNMYFGEYMQQYSWSEFTTGNLNNLSKFYK